MSNPTASSCDKLFRDPADVRTEYLALEDILIATMEKLGQGLRSTAIMSYTQLDGRQHRCCILGSTRRPRLNARLLLMRSDWGC